MGGVLSKRSKEYYELKKYLDNGGDPNSHYRSFGNELILYYIHFIDCLELLLQYGADPNKPVIKGRTPLFYYYNMYSDIKRLKLFLKYGAFINNGIREYMYSLFIHETVYINMYAKETFEYICKKLAQRRWTFVKCYVKLLAVHKRAVVSANHPNRLKDLGYFEINE